MLLYRTYLDWGLLVSKTEEKGKQTEDLTINRL